MWVVVAVGGCGCGGVRGVVVAVWVRGWMWVWGSMGRDV